jgi:cellulose synthase/poly-beta-1,6-N-acetylglucosamine synthase-like glycosyltransferase
MKLLAARAQGEFLVFTDANVLLDEAAIDNLLAWYADPQVGGVCGTLKYLGEGDSATASVGGLYWRLEERIKSEESRSGNVMGADGSIFSLRRALYPAFPDTVLDDLTVSMAAVFSGHRLIKVEDVVAYERLVAARSEEFRRKIRIAARAYHTHRHLAPQLARMAPVDKFKYLSHKFLRWFGGAFLGLGALSFIALAATLSPGLGALAAALVLAGAVLGTRVKRGKLGALAEIVLALIATQIGVLRAMRGQVVVTWSPAKSR